MKKHLSFNSLLTSLSPYLLISLLLIGCGGNGQKNDSIDSTQADVVLDDHEDSIRHTKEYIAQRIDTLYKYKDDARFCSADFLSLDAQCSKFSHEMGYVYRDYDHWVVGQDIDKKWSYKIKEIKNITEASADVELTIHNFKNRKVILNLVFERGDWFVDDFHISFSGQDLGNVSEKADMLTFIYTCNNEKIDKQYGKTFDINKYLNDMIAASELGDEIVFDKYALIDVDLDGTYEVQVHTLDDFYDAVFSIADGKPVLLVCTDPHTMLDFFEHGVAAQGGCGTGCARGEFCIIKDSRPVCRTTWMDQYNMKGDKIDSESGYTVNDKGCDEETYMKAMSAIGKYVTFEPIWHPIEVRKTLSDYAE